MDQDELKRYVKKYQDELFLSVVPFWTDHAFDSAYGGIYTCLDRYGKLYSTDKSGWFQGRAAWSFSHLYNCYGTDKKWLELAESCLSFAKAHEIDPKDGRMFFSMTDDGRPIRKRRYCGCERFYVAGNAEYSIASKDGAALEEAKRYFSFVRKLIDEPKSDPYVVAPKYIATTRPMRSFGPSMIMMDVCDTMCRADAQNAEAYMQYAGECLQQLLQYHYKESLGTVLETVAPDGSFMEETAIGRVINPGHTLESAWFILRYANQKGDATLIPIAENIYKWAFERGWDKEYGGFYYFVDALHCPPEQYEHDMKLWWPHNEAIIASLRLYQATAKPRYWNDFVMLTEYAFSAFSDPTYGEWYGYLHRDNTPTLPASKGGMFKGPFHLIRMLVEVSSILNELILMPPKEGAL